MATLKAPIRRASASEASGDPEPTFDEQPEQFHIPADLSRFRVIVLERKPSTRPGSPLPLTLQAYDVMGRMGMEVEELAKCAHRGKYIRVLKVDEEGWYVPDHMRALLLKGYEELKAAPYR